MRASRQLRLIALWKELREPGEDLKTFRQRLRFGVLIRGALGHTMLGGKRNG